jgi:hypothetical protein
MIPASTVNETHQRSTPRVLLTVMLPPEASRLRLRGSQAVTVFQIKTCSLVHGYQEVKT